MDIFGKRNTLGNQLALDYITFVVVVVVVVVTIGQSRAIYRTSFGQGGGSAYLMMTLEDDETSPTLIS
jgi:hypothetical protein